MITYATPADATRQPLYFSEAFAALSSNLPLHEAPASRDDVSRDLKLSAAAAKGYVVWPGSSSEPAHRFFDFHDPNGGEDGQGLYLPPTITSYYGHEIVAPYGVTITPLSNAKKTRLCLLEFHRADNDASREVHAVAWQGDNDTLHLTEPLAFEHEILGVYPKILFGERQRFAEEKRDWHLGQMYYGDTSILDVDVETLITPGKVLRA